MGRNKNPKPIKINRIRPSHRRPFYSDWFHFDRIASTLPGRNFIDAVSSIDAPDRHINTRIVMQEKLEEPIVSFDVICKQKSGLYALVSGYITLIKNYDDDLNTYDIMSTEMGGDIFYFAIVCGNSNVDLEAQLSSPWVLVLFKKDDFEISTDMLPVIDVPAKIYGEVVDPEIDINIGVCYCHMVAKVAITINNASGA